jgi:hypothetical protein
MLMRYKFNGNLFCKGEAGLSDKNNTFIRRPYHFSYEIIYPESFNNFFNSLDYDRRE